MAAGKGLVGGVAVAGAEPPPADDAAGWITGLLPDDWFTGPAGGDRSTATRS